MTDKTQDIMELFAKLAHSRYFMAGVWMVVGKRKRHDYDNTRGQYRLLNLLTQHDGLTNAEITELLDIKPSSVSLQVKALEERGFIERKASETDKRIQLIYLTEDGKKRIKKGDSQVDLISEEILTGLSEDEQKQLAQLLKKIADNVKNKHDFDDRDRDFHHHFDHFNGNNRRWDKFNWF
ncbi:MarR family transcriptional regulator [Lactobacillus sp. YT155]|uniref:MarR family winged helix-turn-helix transcriptional regulator n=1 Tax=Lactobacillus sp. YT155 TaxID=3060955 RepID=UPI00265F25B5|nr:MarR family transcriptional regulator [Lactobacillus sp. YT155]MDO1605730.1 MarR family transcriptional regulator [Lactobacillus sp. YT155]